MGYLKSIGQSYRIKVYCGSMVYLDESAAQSNFKILYN